MIEMPEIDLAYPFTDGAIAVNNLESARQRSWSQFWCDPTRPGIAESIVEQEQLTAQFVDDLGALDRLDTLVRYLDRVDATSSRTALIHAQVASTAHRFAEAKRHLDTIGDYGNLSDAVSRLSLSIDQACGHDLDAVLHSRRWMATTSGRLEDLVPLAALHADLREFDKADRVYHHALRKYHDTSPFAVAWVCFQLGVLWGELVSEDQSSRAEYWYQRAIEYLPCYVKARVHLAEIYLHRGRTSDAVALFLPIAASDDPEVHWRLADAMVTEGRLAQAERQLQVARSGFELRLEKHLLAFADHGSEFYTGSGNDAARAFELARINLENRPTLRAFEQAYSTAREAGETKAAAEILASAIARWGGSFAFRQSALAEDSLVPRRAK